MAAKLPNGAPPIPESTEEAAQQQLAKASKIQTALEAVLVDSLRRIDQADRSAVNRYREKTVFGGTDKQAAPEAQTEGDFIVCDDMRIEMPKVDNGQGRWLPALALAASMLTLGGAGAWGLLNSIHVPRVQQPQAPAAQDAPHGVEWEIRYKMGADGKWQIVTEPVTK